MNLRGLVRDNIVRVAFAVIVLDWLVVGWQVRSQFMQRRRAR